MRIKVGPSIALAQMENIRESLEELTLDGVEEIEEIDRGSYGVVKICTYKKLR